MKQLLFIALPLALAGSPAMSATYYVDGSGTGAPEQTISQDTPDSISGGQEGTTFSASATNVGGGSVSVFASEGLSDVTDYNNSVGSHYYGLRGAATATVNYTIRVSGPVTGALIPVHINAIASAGSLDVPDPVGDYYAPIIASTEAQVQVEYAEGDAPVGAYGDLAFIYASTHYDYRYFVDGPDVGSRLSEWSVNDVPSCSIAGDKRLLRADSGTYRRSQATPAHLPTCDVRGRDGYDRFTSTPDDRRSRALSVFRPE